MTKEKYFVRDEDVTVAGQTIRTGIITNDTYGKPRFIVHYSDLGLKDMDARHRYKFAKYRASWAGSGMLVFTGTPKEDLHRIIRHKQKKDMQHNKQMYAMRQKYGKMFLPPNFSTK